MKKLLLVMAMLLMAAIVAFPPMANAVPTLYLLDLDNTANYVLITDGGNGDSNTAAGAVTYIGGIGNFIITVNTGLSKPILGSTSQPQLDLSSVELSGAAGNIAIMFNDTGFSLPGTNTANMSIGGTVGPGSTVTYNTYYSSINAGINLPLSSSVPSLATLIGSLGGFSNPGTSAVSFGGDFSGVISPTNPFSLTEVVIISHTGLGVSNTSFNAALAVVPFSIPVPAPSTLLLLGSGLVGLVGLRFRRKRKN
jgi:hypothetical protein